MKMSTADVARPGRARHWQSVISDVYVPLEFRPRTGGAGFEAELEVNALDGVEFSRLRADPHAVVRSAGAIDRGAGAFVFVMLPRAGELVVEQDGRTARLRPGDLASYDTSRPCRIESGEPFDLTIAKLAVGAFRTAGFPAPPTSCTAVRVDRDSAIGSLASSYLVQLSELSRRRNDLGVGATTVSLLSTTFADLGGTLERREALRRRAEGIVSDRLGDPALDPGRLAAALHVSLRTLQLAFSEVGQSPARFILDMRLGRAATLLADRGQAGRSVTEIAFTAGFGDSSQFSRAFKARLGCSPREYRLREYTNPGALRDR
ncbi:helix-turn-helix domain-containing protein [Pseudonocardia sp. KRD291]|uniref:helix-turn-helix domain-containing protein n=1 Tax=Pseudonocardia sp. KRD291 TaxID=2792007 RepID=UPI001C49EB1B|nr:helix-turn-helix domain-containing protein [Pseudonocardia sp. KRD291]MBW0101090.1 helix-turn-helix domain-containing protein [Pseudonocardia sp. KRD291]